MTEERPRRTPGPFEAVDPLALVDNDVAPELLMPTPVFVQAAPIAPTYRSLRDNASWEPTAVLPPPAGPKPASMPAKTVRRASMLGRLVLLLLVPLLILGLGMLAAKLSGAVTQPDVGVQPAGSASPVAASVRWFR